jgi:hypothetical protein
MRFKKHLKGQTMYKKTYIISAVVLLFIHLQVFSQDPDRRAVLDVAREYVDAMYEADGGKMEECLYDSFIKNGFYWKTSEGEFSDMTRISRTQMIQIAKDWNKDDWVPEDAPRDINLLDMQEKIAVVRVTAYWGVDYLQLSKNDTGWLIVQILSQNWPRNATQKDAER